jgi:hypothetical protein
VASSQLVDGSGEHFVGWSSQHYDSVIGKPSPIEVLATTPDRCESSRNDLSRYRAASSIKTDDVGWGTVARAIDVLVDRKLEHPAISLGQDSNPIIGLIAAVQIVATTVDDDPMGGRQEQDREDRCQPGQRQW